MSEVAPPGLSRSCAPCGLRRLDALVAVEPVELGGRGGSNGPVMLMIWLWRLEDLSFFLRRDTPLLFSVSAMAVIHQMWCIGLFKHREDRKARIPELLRRG